MNTISLKTAKQLRNTASQYNYNFKQKDDPLFMWLNDELMTYSKALEIVNEDMEWCVAYTTNELLKELPYEWVLHKTPDNQWNTFNKITDNNSPCEFQEEPQEALAKLFIYLIEKDLI